MTPQEKAVMEKVNAIRHRHGLKPLTYSSALHKAAQFHAEDMAKRNYFSHDSIDGTVWWKRIARFLHGAGRNIGTSENIAYGQDTSTIVVQAWMDSPDHRANILRKSMRTAGVGFARRGQTEYWVQDFGSR